jgi:TRAP-type C4-dicarboxylate transport system substrate-binding protein
MFQLKTITTATCAAIITLSGAANATELKLSHQWSTKDVRHKVAQIVADEVAAAGVDLNIKIFPSKSLVKPKEQYNYISRNLLDMSVFPLSYAAGSNQP